MKLLHIIHSFHWAGAENNVVTLTKGLIRRKIEVEIVCAAGDNEKRFHKALEGFPVRVIGYDFARGISLVDVLKIAGIIVKNNYDIVHVHQVGYGGATGRLAAKLAGRRVIATEHNLSFEHVWLTNPLKKWFHEKCFHPLWNAFTIDHIIANSSVVAEATIKRERLHPNKITTINLGIKLPPQKLRKEKETLFKKAINDEIIIGYIGRLSPEKGVVYVLKALPFILSKYKNIKVIIAGDGPHKNVLQRSAEELGISERVFFIGWIDQVFETMKQFDIMVVPSLNEPFGIVVLEAMACGVPLIAAYSGGIKDILPSNESCALLVPPADSEAITNAILRLLEDTTLRVNMVENAFKRFCTHFTDDIMIRKTIAIYRMVCGNKWRNL